MEKARRYYTKEAYERSFGEIEKLKLILADLKQKEEKLTLKVKEIRKKMKKEGKNNFQINMLISKTEPYKEREKIRREIKKCKEKIDHWKHMQFMGALVWEGNFEENLRGIAGLIRGTMKKFRGYIWFDAFSFLIKSTDGEKKYAGIFGNHTPPRYLSPFFRDELTEEECAEAIRIFLNDDRVPETILKFSDLSLPPEEKERIMNDLKDYIRKKLKKKEKVEIQEGTEKEENRKLYQPSLF